jgi:predicted dehydrogenase
VLEKKKPLITGEDGRKALEIAQAAMQSSAKNRAIKLEK